MNFHMKVFSVYVEKAVAFLLLHKVSFVVGGDAVVVLVVILR